MQGEVFPRDEPRTRQSKAEVAIWRALRRALPPGWRAWHSLRLRSRRNRDHYEGEGDFVIANPARGAMILEVKGGVITCRDGHWYQNGNPMRAPRLQALTFRDHLAEVLYARGVDPPPIGVACAFPDVDFSIELAPDAGDLEGLVLGPRHLEWLAESLPPMFERAVRDAGVPRDPRWLDALHRLWGATWVPSVSLADVARDGANRTIALVDDQLRVLNSAEDNPRAHVVGGAGTGKTLLARELCRRAAARGQRVLYLCFTDALARAVDRGFEVERAGGADVRAVPLRRYAGELLEATGDALPPDPSSWETAASAAAERALPPAEARPDVIVVDEAQDLDAGDWALVAALIEDRGLWILGDERQAFWSRPTIPAELLRGAARLKLEVQLRNPPSIAALAARYVVGAATDAPRPPAGDELRVLTVDPAHELDAVAEELRALLAGGARPGDIAIVTLAGQGTSALLRRDALADQPLARADAAGAADRVVADTVLRFKGLERPFVIVVELAAGRVKQYDCRMHIAVTRAMARLVVIATAADVAADPRLAAR